MAVITVNGVNFDVLQVGATGLYTPWGTTFSGQIQTVVGNGTVAIPADGSTAATSPLTGPQSVAVDHNGNLYIAAYQEYRVRKVDPSTGLITTFAGSGGCCGGTGDNGPATQATLGPTLGVSLDANGNLFIADQDSQTVRRVDAVTGVIKTVAGSGAYGFSGDNGLATAAALGYPSYAAADANGNLFILDANNYRIRRVDASTQIITTIAGTGTSGYSGDGGLATQAEISISNVGQIAIDSAGNIYFTDTGNARIRRIDASTNVISTVAGGGPCCNSNYPVIPTATYLSEPEGLAFDGLGDMFIADYSKRQVYRVDATTGLLSPVAGSGAFGFSGDGGPAISAGFEGLSGIAVDSLGNLLLADQYNYRVRFVDLSSPALIINPALANQPSSAGPGSMAITAPGPNTFWAASSNAAWLTLSSSSGTGSGTLNYTVASNASSASPRSGVITINGRAYLVVQTAAALSLSSAFAVVGAAMGSGSLTVTTGAAWSAASSASWLTVLPASGTGTASLTYSYTANTGTAARMATLSIGGQSFTVMQNGASTQYTPWGAGSFGQIRTIAGYGSSTYSGDGEPATSAGLYALGTAVDGNGDVYIVDEEQCCCCGGNNRIRRVDASTGLISTAVGNGVAGYGGDGGLASQTLLNNPVAVATDKSGNLYIADQGNYRVRMVNISTGNISTVAGTGVQGYSGDGAAATSAQFGSISAVAVDAFGNLFVADSTYSVVRRVDFATGIIATIAGNGTAGFAGDTGPASAAKLNSPKGLALDRAGNLFIADYGNYRIRRVDAVTGNITTVAGNGCCGSLGDGGLATAALLDNPSAVALDAAGNLYIADTNGNKIRRVNALSGIITTVAGNGSTGYNGDGIAATSASISGPTGIAVDPLGNLYIADYGNNRVRFVDETTPQASLSGSTAAEGFAAGTDSVGLTVAAGAAWNAASSAGWLTVTNPTGTGPATISFSFSANSSLSARQATITVLGQNLTVTQAGVTASLSSNSTIASSTAGSASVALSLGGTAAWTASTNATWLSVLPTSGSARTTLTVSWTASTGASPRIGQVQIAGQMFGVTQLGTSGSYTDWGTTAYGQIRTIAGTGVAGFSGDLGPATAAQISNPAGVAVDSSGNVYISDSQNNRIRFVNAATGVITTFAGNGSSGFSGDGGPAFSAQLNGPTGVTLDTSGNLFIADTSNFRVRRVDAATGVITTVAGGTCCPTAIGDGGLATSASLYPRGVAVDSAGNLYIADADNERVRRVDAGTHIITTIAGNGSAAFSGDGGLATSASLLSPTGVALDASGDIYIADFFNGRVRRVDALTGIITTVAGNGTCCSTVYGVAATATSVAPQGLTIDPSGNLIVADNRSRVYRVSLSTGIISAVAGTGSNGFSGDGGAAANAQLTNPEGVAVDANGSVYIADSGNNRVRFVDLVTPQVTLAASSAQVGAAAGSGNVGITILPAGSAWTAGSTAPWLTLVNANAGAVNPSTGQPVPIGAAYNSGVGSGAIGYTYTANPSTVPRSALISAFGQTFLVIQAGISVSLSAPSAVVTASAGNGSFNITTGAALNWTATSNAAWLTVGTPSGNGGGAVNYSFTANTGTSARLGAITIAGLTFTVLQRGTSGGYSIWGPSSQGTIMTIAGNGTAGFSGDQGAAGSATNSMLHAPRGTAVDAAGNVFIADSGNSRIRRLAAANQNLTTVAGSNLTGFCCDNGPATSAALSVPVAVSVDASEDLFIGDPGASVVRRVDGTTGIITTVNQSTASLSDYGVANDSAGNLYISDTANNRVLRWDVNTGTTTVFAGTGTNGFGGDGGLAYQAFLNGPQALAVDALGDVYIADTRNNRIREVNASTGIITTVAGGGAGSDGSLATAAAIPSPMGLAIDPSGNLFIGVNCWVRRVDAITGILSTVAGTGACGYGGDGGPARAALLNGTTGISVDGLGNLYIPDNGNNRVRFVDLTSPAGPVITGIANVDFSAPPLAPGSLASVSGLSLAPTTMASSTLPVPTTLAGVTVMVNGVAAPIQWVSPTQINILIPYETATGTASVTVSYNGLTSNAFTFSVATADPAILYISNPDGSTNAFGAAALPGAVATVYFTGGGAATPAVADGAAAPSASLAILNATVLASINGTTTGVSANLLPGAVGIAEAHFTVPSNLIPGLYSFVVVVNGKPSGSRTLYVGGAAPVVTTVTPGYAVAGASSANTTIVGANFTSGSNVVWTTPGGQSVTISPSLLQAAEIQATIPANLLTTPGAAQIAIANPVGTLSNSVPFIIAPFAITGANPNFAQVNSANTPIVVSGSNLGTAASVNFIAPGGAVSSIPLTLVQAAQAQATLPALALTSAGTAQLALMNGSGAASNSLPFYVTPFTLSSLSPSPILAGSAATTITITGQNLSTAMTLYFTSPGGQVTGVTPIQAQATQVTASIPANLLTTAGTARITLADANGNLSNALSLTIQPFTISTVTPNSVNVGSPATSVTVTGTSLSNAASLYFITPSGVPVPLSPSLVEAAEVQATLPAVLMSSPGTAQIALADPNGALSNELPFSIVTPVSVLISASGQSGFAGQNVQIPILIAMPGSASPAGFQADLSFDATKLTFVSASAGPQATAAGKSITTSTLDGGAIRLLASGLNQNAIAGGTVAYATFTVNAAFARGSTSLTVSNCAATDASGNSLATGCGAPVPVETPCNCDINGDGKVDVSDVQLIINEALGIIPAVNDLNHDGVVNIADVQIVINSVLGFGCPAP